MSISISSVVDRILTQVREPLQKTEDAASGNITRQDCLGYYNKARRKLQRHINIVKGDDRIVAVSGQMEYNLPADYKSNLYRVEFNAIPLAKANFEILDGYDSNWRLSTTRNPPNDDPRYYVPDLKNKKLLIYPPPAANGESQSFIEAGIPESIGIEEGVPESIALEGETFDTTLPGLPEQLIVQANNIRCFYHKYFVDVEVASYITFDAKNVDAELEQHLDAVEEYIYFMIYGSEIKYNKRLMNMHLTLFNDEIVRIREDKIRAFPFLKRATHRKAGYGWGRRVHTNLKGVV